MKRKRHNPEQIICKLRSAEQLLNQGQTVADLFRALEYLLPPTTVGSISTAACRRSRPEAISHRGQAAQGAGTGELSAVAFTCRGRTRQGHVGIDADYDIWMVSPLGPCQCC
jgi:hypothetical protein